MASHFQRCYAFPAAWGGVTPNRMKTNSGAYYRDTYRIELGKGRRPTKKRLWRIASVAVERALDVIPRLRVPCSTVDAGCGAGELVYMLTVAGCASCGFDPDSNHIQWARNLLGIKVASCGIGDMEITPGTQDLVTMYHVLEHLPDPCAALTICAKWLKENGLLVLELPNIESIAQGPGHRYQKGHLHYFNRITLEAVASRSGLRTEHVEEFANGENLRAYFRKDSRVQPLPLQSGNAERIVQILEPHKRWTHYTSRVPYRRSWGRFSRTIAETIHTSFRSDASILRYHAARLRKLLGMISPTSDSAG